MSEWLELARAEHKLARSARRLYEEGLIAEDFSYVHENAARFWEEKHAATERLGPGS